MLGREEFRSQPLYTYNFHGQILHSRSYSSSSVSFWDLLQFRLLLLLFSCSSRCAIIKSKKLLSFTSWVVSFLYCARSQVMMAMAFLNLRPFFFLFSFFLTKKKKSRSRFVRLLFEKTPGKCKKKCFCVCCCSFVTKFNHVFFSLYITIEFF